MKGIEVYTWKESSDWFCVLTGGTNILKTTYEIKNYKMIYHAQSTL